MKVLPFQIPKSESVALIYQEDRGIQFYDKYHQHREIQISMIVSGKGTMIVGDTVNQYKTGDVFVIGSGLPHVLQSDGNNSELCFMKSLFFNIDSFGNDFFDLEEMKQISPFIKRAENGFKVRSNINRMHDLFDKLPTQNQLDRFISFLMLLSLLSKSRYQTLSGFHLKRLTSLDEGKRISEVMSYSINHFNEPISLKDVAQVASMTKNAFCKYFKKRTNKTYIQFLNEIRVEQACKLLLDRPELNIAEIADSCGFHNMSNFNRQFKAIKKMTPSEIQKMK